MSSNQLYAFLLSKSFILIFALIVTFILVAILLNKILSEKKHRLVERYLDEAAPKKSLNFAAFGAAFAGVILIIVINLVFLFIL